jgi:hypothetical protein
MPLQCPVRGPSKGHPIRSAQISPYPPYSHCVVQLVLQQVAQFCLLMNCANGMGCSTSELCEYDPTVGFEYANMRGQRSDHLLNAD